MARTFPLVMIAEQENMELKLRKLPSQKHVGIAPRELTTTRLERPLATSVAPVEDTAIPQELVRWLKVARFCALWENMVAPWAKL